jgi:hypothetical protein
MRVGTDVYLELTGTLAPLAEADSIADFNEWN